MKTNCEPSRNRQRGKCGNCHNHHWTIMVKFYNLKTDPRYGYNRATKGEKAPSYVYSQQTVELIVDSIRRNPHVLTDLLAKGFR
nr:hypothetical protein [Mobiluncus mulieris]